MVLKLDYLVVRLNFAWDRLKSSYLIKNQYFNLNGICVQDVTFILQVSDKLEVNKEY
jgi:hypothetical protein